MMTGDREMRTTRGLNDTQPMLARDAGDERSSRGQFLIVDEKI
jgi:hypothetical protein